MAIETKTRQGRYAERRKARQLKIDFYLDDLTEAFLYESLKAEKKGNMKKIILGYLKQHYKEKGNEHKEG